MIKVANQGDTMLPHPTRRAVITAGPVMLGAAVGRSTTAENTGAVSHASLLSRPFLFAGDFGVMGTGDVDETRAVQAFLDACAAAGGRTAYFGAMRVQISGPLFARSVGVVFDRQSYGVDDPGFRVTGAAYTALTVTGLIADFNVTIYGEGGVTFDKDGRVARDTRPRVNGFQFGADDASVPLMASVIRHARAYKLSGFGIRHTACFDTSFLAESVEECGNEHAFAFEVAGSLTHNCNESSWLRVQVELSATRAMAINPNTLSCSFVKIHSERATAVAGVPTWQLGGACEFGSVRCQASNPALASMLVTSAQAECRNFRVEDNIPISIDATGGVVNLYNPIATLVPQDQQNGRVNVIGGQVRALGIGAGWTFTGTRLDLLELGFMPPATWSTAISCDIRQLVPQKRATQGEIILQSCQASGRVATADGQVRHLQLLAGTRLVPADRILDLVADMTVDASSSIAGSVRVRGGGLKLSGRINGDLEVEGAHRSLAGQEATVGGRVAGWMPPTATIANPIANGTYCKNLTLTGGMPGQASVSGWIRVQQQWVGLRLPN